MKFINFWLQILFDFFSRLFYQIFDDFARNDQSDHRRYERHATRDRLAAFRVDRSRRQRFFLGIDHLQLFDVSLDKLVMGKEEEEKPPSTTKSEFVTVINEKVLTNKNKKRAKSILKVVGIILITIPLIDVISMIIYFAVNDMLP